MEWHEPERIGGGSGGYSLMLPHDCFLPAYEDYFEAELIASRKRFFPAVYPKYL